MAPLKLFPTAVTLLLGDALTIAAVRDPGGGVLTIASGVRWSSSDTTTAPVSQQGRISALRYGDAIVTARAGGDTAAVAVTVDTGFRSLSGGSERACAVTARGGLYCWGLEVYGPATVDCPYYLGIHGDCTAVPTGVFRSVLWSSLSHGLSCGLDVSGQAYCWKDGRPERVAGGLTFAMLTTGGGHTCALTEGSTAYCWGLSEGGALGTTPVPVSGGLTFTSITAGLYYTCGISSGGLAYCWGNNYWGELGNGSRDSTSPSDHPTPTPVAGDLTFIAISASGFHTCGIATGGTAYCWGRGLNGVLGNGSALNEAQSTPVPVSGALRFIAIEAGSGHVCALEVDGAAYCWGLNGNSQLGVSSTTELCPDAYNSSSLPCSTIPVRVSGNHSFSSITLGGEFTCGLDKVGDGYCWGDNSWGTLGTGDRTMRSSATPVRVLRRLATVP